MLDGLHHQLVEAILIIGLVFMFAPFRRVLQRLFTQVFFRETYTYREVLNELAQTLRRGPVRRLTTLLDQVARTVRKTFSVDDARVILLDESDAQTQRWWYRPPRVEALTAWLTAASAPDSRTQSTPSNQAVAVIGCGSRSQSSMRACASAAGSSRHRVCSA